MAKCRPGRRAQGNGLLRRSDVFEAWAALLLGVLALLVAPAAGTVTGWVAHAEARQQAEYQAADRHPVQARLAADAPESVPAQSGVQIGARYPVPVRWTDRAGRTRTVTALVPAGLDRGDRTTVWLDGRGAVTTQPWGGYDIWSRTVSAALLVTLTVAGLAATARCALHRFLDRRRLAGWEREWRRVGPEWSRRSA